MPQNDLLQQAISNIRVREVPPDSGDAPSDDLLQQAISRLRSEEVTDRRRDENIFRAPEFAQKGVLGALTGIGQELAETAYKVPRLFGVDVGRPPQAVETGLPEKLAAGAVEYGLGGGALGAVAPLQKAFGALSKIPKIGKILAPAIQRATGAGVMGAVETPEEPLKGAEIGAALSPLLDVGLWGGGKLLKSVMDKLKLSPTLLRKPVVKEFNSLVDETSSKLGLKRGQDTDKAAFDYLNNEYGKLRKKSNKLYTSAEKALEGVNYSSDDVEIALDEEIATLENSPDPLKVAAHRSLKILKENIKNPGKFLKEINKTRRSAYKTGNFSLITPLEEISKTFEQTIGNDLKLRGNRDLVSGMAKLNKASDFFKKNIVPFRQRGSEMTEYGKHKPIFTEFFKAHNAGTSKGFLNKIGTNIQDLKHLSKISPKIKKYFSLSEFKKGFNDPNKLIKSFNDLSNEQKNIYFTPQQLYRLKRFSSLHDEHPEIFGKAKAPAVRFREVPFPSARFTGIPAIAEGILGQIGKTPIAKEALESALQKTVTPAARSPMLAGLIKGGLLGSILPGGER